MATGPSTLVADAIVPSIFAPYMLVQTATKSALVQSGILQRSAFLDEKLAGGGLTFNFPSWKDLDDDADAVQTVTAADMLRLIASQGSPALPAAFDDLVPYKMGSIEEIAVRMSRAHGVSVQGLVPTLAGDDPMLVAADRVSSYWTRRLQTAFIATMSGVNKDNGTNDSGDYALDVVGGSFVEGVTNFTAENFLNARNTLGDRSDETSIVIMHSTVYNRANKNNLIDFIPDSNGVVDFPTFLGHRVVVDDGMPSGTGVVRADGSAGSGAMYETWICAPGVAQLGMGTPAVPVEVERHPRAGQGAGEDTLITRQEWCIHPVGHSYIGTAPKGGPSNAATTHNLNIATSWNRVYPQRKQVKYARLITREA